jgi:hypothetical protein
MDAATLLDFTAHIRGRWERHCQRTLFSPISSFAGSFVLTYLVTVASAIIVGYEYREYYRTMILQQTTAADTEPSASPSVPRRSRCLLCCFSYHVPLLMLLWRLWVQVDYFWVRIRQLKCEDDGY